MSVIQWIRDNKFNIPNEQTPVPTHLNIKGGTFYIPERCHKEFLYLYSQDLKNGIKLYLVECRSRIFKFMLDYDITDDHFWSKKEIEVIGKITSKVVHKYLENSYISVICSTNKPKIKVVNDIKKIHSGIHIIFPHLYVNSETAQTLRTAILMEINNSVVEDPLIKELYSNTMIRDFTTVIDERIYNKNGYRMIGSDKVDENRWYFPDVILSSSGQILEEQTKLIKENYTQMMHYTAIRLVPDNIYYDSPNGIQIIKPPWFKEIKDPQFEKVQYSSSKYTNNGTIDKLNTFIDNIGIFGTDIVQDIIYADDIESYFIKVKSRYCMNMGRKHNSCGIYFVIDHWTLIQKCYCACNTKSGRLDGYCCDYSSPGFKISEEIFDDLYKYEFLQDDRIDKTDKPVISESVDDVINNVVIQMKKEVVIEKEKQKKKGKEKKQKKLAHMWEEPSIDDIINNFKM